MPGYVDVCITRHQHSKGHRLASVQARQYGWFALNEFYLPLHWAAHSILPKTADIIRLIIRDEAVHGHYIGYKFQRGYHTKTPARQRELRDFAYDMLTELYDNETDYAHDLYDSLGMADPVLPYMRYNANKALSNLGFEPLFTRDDSQVPAEILSALDPGAAENHDFFSGSGNAYIIGTTVNTTDDDWTW